MILHGSCAASRGAGVLFLGAPGAGKSDLVLRLLHQGWRLVADDQVMLAEEAGALRATAPEALSGMLEVRGLGLFEGLPHGPAPLRLVVELAPRDAVPRLPLPRRHSLLGHALPCLALHGFDASAPAKLDFALAGLGLGGLSLAGLAPGAALAQRAGAFAA
ncbi:HPr kinase/phosphorylase [Pseudoroseomonas cervicalis]|uniref:HPr kinase/phosphorylase n=1 Tax=Teichococcus cervicalis TaxID=204525 RepID=UPI00278AFC1E|nr:aldolase [Pseudoroseomonas cervicalis]MDQ1081085.1 HPr kinase/phosphorylase [Pseudoroseomonas cervicalis]